VITTTAFHAAMEITTELERNRNVLLNTRKNVSAAELCLSHLVASCRWLSCLYKRAGRHHTPIRVRQVGAVSAMTDQARRVLRSMAKRETRIKVVLALFMLGMIGLIVFIIYYIAGRKRA
jgi:hypothetical protein